MSDVGSLYNGLTGKAKADFLDGNARFVTYVNVFKNLATELSGVLVIPGRLKQDCITILSNRNEKKHLRGPST